MRINVYFANSEIEKFDEFIDLALGLSVYNSVSVFISYKFLLEIAKKDSLCREHLLKRMKMLELYDLTPVHIYNITDDSSFIDSIDNLDLSEIVVYDKEQQGNKYLQVDLVINF